MNNLFSTVESRKQKIGPIRGLFNRLFGRSAQKQSYIKSQRKAQTVSDVCAFSPLSRK